MDKSVFIRSVNNLCILPQSDLPRSLEDTIRELLKQNYVPSIRNGNLLWIHPSQYKMAVLLEKLKAARRNSGL